MLGSQAPSAGASERLLEKVAANLETMTKAAPRIIPMAKCRPIPPRTFLDATAKPIIVRINNCHQNIEHPVNQGPGITDSSHSPW